MQMSREKEPLESFFTFYVLASGMWFCHTFSSHKGSSRLKIHKLHLVVLVCLTGNGQVLENHVGRNIVAIFIKFNLLCHQQRKKSVMSKADISVEK